MRNASAAKISPLQYKDYRAFLMDYWRKRKAAQPAWSYGVWARQLGLKSSSTLIMILNGDRNPGRGLVKDFARYFHWSEKEERYFTDLIRFQKNSRRCAEQPDVTQRVE